MNFLIITHVQHKKNGDFFAAYEPYVREMNLWFNYVDKVTVVAPLINESVSPIDLNYKHENIKFHAISSIQFTTLKNTLVSIFKIPQILTSIFRACKKADHIHLRCPGNIGLLGCLIQICFPKKIKTAKYAGNWDPKSKQPLSYRFQKCILSNTFLTKKINVLVYGDWKNQTKNIKSFFTATYKKSEIDTSIIRNYDNKLKFVFVGSLVKGKRPFLSIKIVEKLYQKNKNVSLDIYGDGILKKELQDYINKNNLNDYIIIHGNQKKDIIKQALKASHFLILPSVSEGWPKAIAEAMFFGVIPIATKISCVPFMLDQGKRGVLIGPDLERATQKIKKSLEDQKRLELMSSRAIEWSQQYTLDVFESEIVKLLKP